MDAVTQLIISIGWSVAKKLPPFLKKHFLRNENIESLIFKNTNFEFIIERDSEQISDFLLDNAIEGENLELASNFFNCPHIEDIIGKIYALNQSIPLGFLDVNNIYSDFDSLVVEYFDLQSNKPNSFSAKLFEILIEGCNNTLIKLNNEGKIQSLNALFNFQDFIKEYLKIQSFYNSLNNHKSTSGYLSRKVCPGESYDSSNIFLLTDKLENIHQVIEKEMHISLLSDAGMGKTTELKQIAYYYSKLNSSFYPIFVSLNKYASTKSISEYFPNYWEFIPENKLLIILDGFDEIQSKDKKDAIREIEHFVEKHEHIRIIVSCRNNFYNIETENDQGLLDGFKSYVLVELERDEIGEYVRKKLSTRSVEFFDVVSKHSLNNLIEVPFSLIYLVELFEKEYDLPSSKAEIFETLLESRIQLDIKHYRTTEDLEEEKEKIIDDLAYIALSMECLGRNYITDDEFKKLLPEASSRKLLQYCTTWKKLDKDPTTWQFEHNNFQEYLAAKRMSTLPTETIKHLVSFEPHYNKIIPSWTNTLSFIISLSNNQELLNWILEINPEFCVNFEADKIEKLKRIQIFKHIFNNYKTKKIWINSGIFKYYEFAKFGESDEIIDFLLNEATSATHYTTIDNAINLLCELNIPYTKRVELQNILIQHILDNNNHGIVRNDALRCLSIQDLYSKENLDQIISELKQSESERIRSGLYYLLSNSDYVDDYIDIFLDGIKLTLNRDILSSSEFTYLLKALNEMKSSESIKKILMFFTRNPDDLDRLYGKREFGFLSNSIDAYSKDPSLLDSYLEFFKVLFLDHHRYYDKCLLKFFECTDTKLVAFQTIYSNKENDNTKYLFLAALSDTSSIEFLIKEYEERKITKDEICKIQYSLINKNWELGIQFNRLLHEKFRNEIPLVQTEKYDYGEKNRVQEDFNLLFNKELFIEEINNIFGLINKKECTCRELFSLDIQHRDYYLSELVITTLCTISRKDTLSLEKALEYIDLKWDSFCINKIYEMLSRSEEINISAEQRKYISDWCFSHLDGVNFKQAISYEDKQINANWIAIYLWYFYRKLELSYPKDILLDMISFDWSEKNGSVDLGYLERQLEHQEMKNRVLENLNKGIDYDLILRNHIMYCKKYNIKDILHYTLDIIADINRDYQTRKLALDITCEMSETLSTLENILPNINDQFKWDVVKELIRKNNIHCETFLLNILDNANEDDKLKAAEYLMTNQNLKGLKFFVEWVKEHNRYPYHVNESPLKSLYVSESIPFLLELLKLTYNKDFIQEAFRPLHIEVLEVLTTIALNSEENYLEIKNHIEKFIDEKSAENDSINFLYSYLNNLGLKFYMSKNVMINVEIVLEKLKENGINRYVVN